MTLTPAYGRDYKSKKEVLADWEAGKDFIANSFNGSGSVNKNDCPKGSHQFRYKKLTQVFVHQVK